MESEHDEAGELLEVIKHITHNVTPPPEACTTWKAMYNGINEMIDDLMEHISLENNVLFPRALGESKEKGARGRPRRVRLIWPLRVAFYDGPLQATLKFSFISPAVFAGKQPARAQQHKPQRGDHQRFTGIVFQGQQHQHKDEEGHAHPAHDFT